LQLERAVLALVVLERLVLVGEDSRSILLVDIGMEWSVVYCGDPHRSARFNGGSANE
jgi:hypothetical protein